jgi:hypothetical protein
LVLINVLIQFKKKLCWFGHVWKIVKLSVLKVSCVKI